MPRDQCHFMRHYGPCGRVATRTAWVGVDSFPVCAGCDVKVRHIQSARRVAAERVAAGLEAEPVHPNSVLRKASPTQVLRALRAAGHTDDDGWCRMAEVEGKLADAGVSVSKNTVRRVLSDLVASGAAERRGRIASTRFRAA